MRIRPNWRDLLAKLVEGQEWAPICRRAKLNPTYLRDVLDRHQTPQIRSAEKLSGALGVDLTDWFIEPPAARDVAPENGTVLANSSSKIGEEPLTDRAINPQQFPRDLPILGSGACGEDGLFELNGQIHGYARRPPRLMGVRGAYAIYVQGESMWPWRKPGQLALVDPYQPPKIGDFVVVQLKASGKDENHHPAYIKQLVRWNAKELRLHQFNPGEDLTLPAAKVHSVHRVIDDWAELLGL